MANAPDISSEEELSRLRDEGKISEEEYRQLRDAMQESRPKGPQPVRGLLRDHVLKVVLIVIILAAVILPVAVIVMNRRQSVDLGIAKGGFRVGRHRESGLYCATVSIPNLGARATPKFDVHFYVGDPNTCLPMTHSAGPIKPGDMWNERTFPFALKDGDSQVLVVLDPHNRVREFDEKNNCARLRVVVSQGQIIKKTLTYPLEKLENLEERCTEKK